MKSFYRRSVLTVIALIYLVIFALPAGALEIGARAAYWFPSLNATLRGGSTGTEINIRDDLGIGNKNTYWVEAFGGIGNHHLSLSYMPLDYSSGTTLARPIIFNNATFAAGSSVTSDLNLKMIDVEYRYDLLNFENLLAGFSINLLAQLKYLDGEAKMNSASTGLQRVAFTVPVPMVGAGVHVGLIANLLEARAKVTGIGYSGSYFVDALADIGFTPFPFTRIFGGYRYMKLKIDNVSDTFGNLDFYGPYVGLSIAW